MELTRTVKNFHPVTKIVIGLTVLLLGLILAALIASVYWMSNPQNQAAFGASQGFGSMAMALSAVLMQAFLLLLVIIAIYMAAMEIKKWIEKYLDSMLARLDTLAEQKTERDAGSFELAAISEKVSRMEKKLDNIENILSKVSE
ncbi:MAG: hypothetical protein WC586_07180 [Methanoregula sp.]